MTVTVTRDLICNDLDNAIEPVSQMWKINGLTRKRRQNNQYWIKTFFVNVPQRRFVQQDADLKRNESSSL